MKIYKWVSGLTLLLLFSCSDTSENSIERSVADKKSETVTEEVQAELDPMLNKGIGSISSIDLKDIDQNMVSTGSELFKSKCSACHKIEKRYIGPALAGVIERRSPEWIMNMILDPEKMVANDPIAKGLLMEYNSPMANQSLTEEEARTILEYFRTL